MKYLNLKIQNRLNLYPKKKNEEIMIEENELKTDLMSILNSVYDSKSVEELEKIANDIEEQNKKIFGEANVRIYNRYFSNNDEYKNEKELLEKIINEKKEIERRRELKDEGLISSSLNISEDKNRYVLWVRHCESCSNVEKNIFSKKRFWREPLLRRAWSKTSINIWTKRIR